MPFIVQKISDHGSSDPIIARVVIQTIEIARLTTLSKPDQEHLVLDCNHIARRLVNAREAAQYIKKKANEGIDALKAIDAKAETVELPFVVNLDILVEGYFYNAKNIIRDIGGVMKPLYGKRFTEASEWCAFGKKPESEVSRHFRQLAKANVGYMTVRELIEQSRESLELVVRVRNALEHPGKAAGTLEVANFRADKDGTIPPFFKFVGEADRYDLVRALADIQEMLLALVETVIVFGLMGKFAMPKLGLYRLKESERDPKAPVAYRVVNITEDMEKGSKPFDGKPPTID